MAEETNSTRGVRLALAALVLAGVAGCAGGEEPPPPKPALGGPEALARAVGVPGLSEHIRELERIAGRHGGNRGAATAGDRASVAYVTRRLRAAGWRVRSERVVFPYFEERFARLESGGRPLPLVALRYSGSGSVAGPARAVGSGCSPAEYAGFARGDIAVARRGGCLLRRSARSAQAAGAAGVIVYDPKRAGPPLAGTLVSPGLRIPAVAVGRGDGRALARSGGEVRLRVDAVSERRDTTNVIAELGSGRRLAVAGAHLDSVPEGPGANDNGSGVAVLLELAEAIGSSRTRPSRRRLQLAFWGAEELGLFGSRQHVRRLSRAERRRIGAYLNLDMVGSANGGRFAYGGRRGAARRALRAVRRFYRPRGLKLGRVGAGGASDHAPFQSAGVSVLGLYSGGPERKKRAQARAWGGTARRPFDSCYHRPCDSLARIDERTLAQLSDGAAVAVWSLAF